MKYLAAVIALTVALCWAGESKASGVHVGLSFGGFNAFHQQRAFFDAPVVAPVFQSFQAAQGCGQAALNSFAFQQPAFSVSVSGFNRAFEGGFGRRNFVQPQIVRHRH